MSTPATLTRKKLVRFQGDQQGLQGQEREYRQFGWRMIELHSYMTLDPF
jgi:hypothetical protein